MYLQVNDRHTFAAQGFGIAELIPDSLVPCHLRIGNTNKRRRKNVIFVPCDLRAAIGARFRRFGVAACLLLFEEREIDFAPSFGGYNNASLDGLVPVVICRPALYVHVNVHVYVCVCVCVCVCVYGMCVW